MLIEKGSRCRDEDGKSLTSGDGENESQ